MQSFLKTHDFNIIPDIARDLAPIVRKGKDRTSNFEMSNVVYKIPCKDCKKSYIGQTKRHLKKRISEHIASIHDDPECVVAVHSNSDHTLNVDNTNVLDIEHDLSRRLLCEMMHIHIQDNALNVMVHSDKQLHNSYIQVISKYKTNADNLSVDA